MLDVVEASIAELRDRLGSHDGRGAGRGIPRPLARHLHIGRSGLTWDRALGPAVFRSCRTADGRPTRHSTRSRAAPGWHSSTPEFRRKIRQRPSSSVTLPRNNSGSYSQLTHRPRSKASPIRASCAAGADLELLSSGTNLWDVTSAPVSIINLATVRDLPRSGGRARPPPVRANLYVEGLEPWSVPFPRPT
jgi:hypothetical protein